MLVLQPLVILWSDSCAAPKLPQSPCPSCVLRKKKKKYEKKQIWLHGRQDSECTLLKCYLGFGNCGLGGLFGQNERGRGREKEAYRRHIYTKGSASARGFICESSSEIAADWVRVMRLQQPAWSSLVAELLLSPDSIALTLQLQYGHTQAKWARESGPIS